MDKGHVEYLVGIGGWEHDVLDRCLYPQAGMTSAEKLAYYARFFSAAEVRPTFWDDSLTADDARGWVEAVAGARTFLFTVKLHSQFTHKKVIKPQLSRTTRDILQTLDRANRLGALLIQLPYSFTNVSGNRYHLTRLGEIFSGFPIHVEFRHESWHQVSTLNFLEENGLRPVSADLPRVRQLMPFGTGVTGDTALLRLHGRNEKGWLLNDMDTRYDYLYNSKELQEIKRRLDALAERCSRVIVICNNTTGGKAVANALQLTHTLRENRSIALPPSACRSFPSVQDLGVPYHPEATLFGTDDFRAAI